MSCEAVSYSLTSGPFASNSYLNRVRGQQQACLGGGKYWLAFVGVNRVEVLSTFGRRQPDDGHRARPDELELCY